MLKQAIMKAFALYLLCSSIEHFAAVSFEPIFAAVSFDLLKIQDLDVGCHADDLKFL